MYQSKADARVADEEIIGLLMAISMIPTSGSSLELLP